MEVEALLSSVNQFGSNDQSNYGFRMLPRVPLRQFIVLFIESQYQMSRHTIPRFILKVGESFKQIWLDGVWGFDDHSHSLDYLSSHMDCNLLKSTGHAGPGLGSSASEPWTDAQNAPKNLLREMTLANVLAHWSKNGTIIKAERAHRTKSAREQCQSTASVKIEFDSFL